MKGELHYIKEMGLPIAIEEQTDMVWAWHGNQGWNLRERFTM